MATKDYALTNETRLKSRLTITVTDFDALLKFLSFSVTDFIESQCSGRRFKRTAYSNEIYDGSILGQENGQRSKYLILKNGPLVTLTSVEYLTGSRSSPTWVAFTADDYVRYNDMGVLYFPSGMPAGVQNIRVNYTAGYLLDLTGSLYDDAVNTMPFELIDLAERLCVKIFKKRESEGRSQETFRESTISWSGIMESADWAIVKNYRRVHIL
jgi:hypothetical protein